MIVFLATMSEACNLNCSYCNVDKMSKKRIDPDLFIAEFHKLRAANPDETIKIDFFGGEPLMQYDMVQYIIEHLRDEPNTKFFMPTNGLLLTEDRIKFLRDNNVEISLSFDGLWQDKNRLQHNDKGTLQRFIDKAELFRSVSGLRVHTMVQRGCYNLLENHQFIKNTFGVNPELTLVRDVGTWSPHSVERVKQGITELFDWYCTNADVEEMPNFIKFYLQHIILYKVKKHEVKSCGAGEIHFSFSENQMTPCDRFKNKPDMVAAIPQFLEMEKCQTCEVRNYCKKGCLHEQMLNGGPIDELCVIYKHIYNETFKMMSVLKGNPSFTSIVKKEIANEL